MNDFPASDLPIIAARRRMVFDGRRYVGQERIPADRGTPRGTPVLTGAPMNGDGAPL